jgi:uncharacterized protein (TIGR02452 family)
MDSAEMAEARQADLMIPRDTARDLGRSAVLAAQSGSYLHHGTPVDWSSLVADAVRAKRTIPPNADLPDYPSGKFAISTVQVTNETTLMAGQRLCDTGLRPLVLNFGNGIHPGGGFLHGARAQEECICRSSALYATLTGDPMYQAHRFRRLPDSSDWAILSPRVPVFRTDSGDTLASPWLLDILTCAAPYAPTVGAERSRALLKSRIHRILAIAAAHGYESLVLGAWGCGAFGNSPAATAADFRDALETDFTSAFSTIVFAITDWSPQRHFLGPFREVFGDR